jgi:hypothetical protein
MTLDSKRSSFIFEKEKLKMIACSLTFCVGDRCLVFDKNFDDFPLIENRLLF